MIGQKLGKYRITGQLGRGGMGVVYTGEHEQLGNRVAIKVLLPEYSHNKQLVNRFFNEAKAATRINHPGIVKVFDFGEHTDGSNYIIMEFLAGEPLSERLRRWGRMPHTSTVRLLQQCASALSAAHRVGIVHRDLKPDNIFLCPDPDVTGGERAKLLDFGVAKLLGDATDGMSSTRTGAVIGTPRFMSPEQCAGGSRPIDQRADLYALGCVGFTMLCGRPPFLHEGLGELLAAHMYQAPPTARSLEPSIPEPVDALLMCLLAKDPAQRYQSADSLVSALGQVAGHVGEAAGSAPGLGAPTSARHHGEGSTPGAVVATSSTTLGSAPVSRPVASTGQQQRSWMWLLAAVGSLGIAGLGLATWFGTGREGRDDTQANTAAGSEDASVGADAAIPDAADDGGNLWVRIEPPGAGAPVVLGVSAATADRQPDALGWRPEREVSAPRAPFAIQQHEVTWGELQPWLDTHADMTVYRPSWLPADDEARARMPATGLPWLTAQGYCAAIGGRLPTEAEWEYAARGAELRPYAWGKERLDRFRTHAYAGPDSQLVPAMSKDQDRTPGTLENALYDMMGNAQEWTADLWRNDAPGGDESWVQQGERTYRAVRGLPPNAPPPDSLPREGAAYRDALCATAACMAGSEHLLASVGVRCARDVRADR